MENDQSSGHSPISKRLPFQFIDHIRDCPFRLGPKIIEAKSGSSALNGINFATKLLSTVTSLQVFICFN